jgi:hypothetical protein
MQIDIAESPELRAPPSFESKTAQEAIEGMGVEVIKLGYVLDGDHGQYKCKAVEKQAFSKCSITDSLTVAAQ